MTYDSSLAMTFRKSTQSSFSLYNPRHEELLQVEKGEVSSDYQRFDEARLETPHGFLPAPLCGKRLVCVYTMAATVVIGGIVAAIYFLSPPTHLCVQAYNSTNVHGGTVEPIRLSIRLCPQTPECIGGVCFEERDGAKGLVVYTKQSTRVRLKIENTLNEATLLHWHGLEVPFKDDGVPGITQPAIPPGQAYRYDFQVPKIDSTHFLHSHFKWQHQQGLSAFFLIVSDKPADKEVVFFLEDRQPQHPLCYTGDSEKCNPGLPMPPPVDKLQAYLMENDGKISNFCLCPALSAQWPSNRTCSCSGKPDVGAMCDTSRCQQLVSCPPCPDLTGADFSNTEDEVYNFCRYLPEQQPSFKWLHARYAGYWQGYDELLVNGKSLLNPTIVDVTPGDFIKLRVINSAGSVCFWVHVPSHMKPGEVLAVDGMPVKRGVYDRRFPVCPGQRIDLRLQVPKNGKEGSWNILAQWAGERNQTGLILRANHGEVVNLPPLLNSLTAPDTNFELERQLQTDVAGAVDEGRVVGVNLTSGWLHGYSLNHHVWNVNPRGKAGLGMSTPNPWPIEVKTDESVCFQLLNQGLVGHPMHLHGHRFKVVELDGVAVDGAVRDTLQIPPRCHRARVCARMKNPGEWLLHCHMIGK